LDYKTEKEESMTDKLAWIDEELANLKETGFYNTIPTMDSPQGASVVINGRRVLNFCANNYLVWPTIRGW